MKKSLLAIPLVVAIAAGGLWLSRSRSTAVGATTTSHAHSSLSAADVDAAIANAIPALRAGVAEDRFALFYEDVARRRFGATWARSSAELTHQLTAEDRKSNPIVVRLLAADPKVAMPYEGAMWDLDRGLRNAFRCRENKPESDYLGQWRKKALGDEVFFPRAALELVVLDALGCKEMVPQADRDQLLARLHDGIKVGDVTTRIEIESGWLLSVLTGPEAVPAGFAEDVRLSQWKAGGWSEDGTTPGSNWHVTGLAILLLLEMSRDPIAPVVPG